MVKAPTLILVGMTLGTHSPSNWYVNTDHLFINALHMSIYYPQSIHQNPPSASNIFLSSFTFLAPAYFAFWLQLKHGGKNEFHYSLLKRFSKLQLWQQINPWGAVRLSNIHKMVTFCSPIIIKQRCSITGQMTAPFSEQEISYVTVC